MILDELNGHLGLLEDLETTRAIRAEFLAKAQPGAASMTGMPYSSDIKDKVGNLAVEIADLDTQIETLECLVRESEKRILPFIASIHDNRTRMIFRLRFIRGLSWKEVSLILGRFTTEKSVSSLCYKYLKSLDRGGAEMNQEESKGIKTKREG